MIKINLLAADKPRAKKKVGGGFGLVHKVTAGCTLILVVTGLAIGWRFLSIRQESARVDAEIAEAQRETARLHSVIQQVQQFEQRKAQLQQRVALIEQLRKEQKGPVHMLDQISRALPPMLWLTELKQGSNSSDVVLVGRSTTLTGLSDFVANLEASGYFRRSVEIISTETQALKTPPGELINFQLKAQFVTPGQPVEEPAAPKRAKGKGR